MKKCLIPTLIFTAALAHGFIKDPAGTHPAVPEISQSALAAQQALGGVRPAVPQSPPRDANPAPTYPVNDVRAANAVASVAVSVGGTQDAKSSQADGPGDSHMLMWAVAVGGCLFGAFWLAGKKQTVPA